MIYFIYRIHQKLDIIESFPLILYGQEVRTPLQDISEDKYGGKSMIGSDSSHRGK